MENLETRRVLASGFFQDSGLELGNGESTGVALGDVDGDGDLDAFVTNYGQRENGQPNKIWLNDTKDGQIQFRDSGQNLGNSNSYSVGLGDLDGDGDLDAFVANRRQPDKVWLNDGQGQFRDSGLRRDVTRYQGWAVELGDVDGDGDLDAVRGHSSPEEPTKVWINDGQGQFQDSGQGLDVSRWTNDVAMGDLDGDDDLDAFFANGVCQGRSLFEGASQNSVWLNDGKGTFQDSGQELGVEISLAAALGDLDADGDLDVFVANGWSFAEPNKVLINSGDGVFHDSGQELGDSQSFDVALGDLDGDGDLDAFVTNRDQPNRIWLNMDEAPPPDVGDANGDGRFDQLDVVHVLQAVKYLTREPATFAEGDWNGDGVFDQKDIVEALQTGIYLQDQQEAAVDIVFAQPVRYITGEYPESVTAGDLDGDGDLDVAVANGGWFAPGDVAVLLNNGDGTLAERTGYLAGVGVWGLSVEDIDADGDLDLITANVTSNNLSVLRNNGDGTFANVENYRAGGSPRSVAVGDLDGDGDLDLAAANSEGANISILANNGDGTFSPQVRVAVGRGPEDVTVGDLDGDGDLDLVVTNKYSSDVSVLVNLGHGMLEERFQETRYRTRGNGTSGGIVGDLDGDGDLDLAVAAYNHCNVGILLGHGDATFAPEVTYYGGDEPFDIKAMDWNGDGILDLAVANGYPWGFHFPGALLVLPGNGDGTFSSGQSFQIGTSSVSLATGDFDQDGEEDIAVADKNSHNVEVIINPPG